MIKNAFLLLVGFFIASESCLAISPKPAMAKQGMVVSEQYLASQVGADILRAGGNAVDAAVAVGYALAVVQPCCGNIGGGGFMLIHLVNGKDIFLNYREKAPLAAKPDMYLDAKGNLIPNKSMQGYLAVAVPGTVMGLETALKKYGTMTRQVVMAPAIKLAEQGFTLSPYDIQMLDEALTNFRQQQNVAAIFLNQNHPYQVGDRLVQRDLATTLKRIAEEGETVFYRGEIAKKIVQSSQANGGILSLDDFAKYTVEELAPLQCHYRGYRITSSPPPSSGGVTLCEIVGILEAYPLDYLGYHSAQGTHYVIEAMRFAFADRNNKLGDPDFVNNPLPLLLSKAYAQQIRKKIQAYRATPSSEVNTDKPEKISTHTTHYSVVDNKGNAVSATYTLNSFFGAGVIAGDTGFFLNDQMDDFSIKPGSTNQFGLVQNNVNGIQPGKRPLSSMTPTIVSKDGHPFLVLGSPGGPRIITSVLQTLLNVIDYGMTVQEAVDAPRYHHQWMPDSIDVEPFTFSADTTEKMAGMGYRFVGRGTWSAVETIMIDPKSKVFYGANDNRRPDGKAVGY